jgi:predicted DNA binding CopG/RHH family protein
MKEPKLSDLTLDEKGTRQMRKRMAQVRKVKITINIDQDSLAVLRAKSATTGIPYQRLLNQVLKSALQDDKRTESRLDLLEKKLNSLERKLIA